LISFPSVGDRQLNAVWYAHSDGPYQSPGNPTGRVARGTLDIKVVDMLLEVPPNPAVVRPSGLSGQPDQTVTIKVKSVNPVGHNFRAAFLVEREAGSGGHDAGHHEKLDGSGPAGLAAGEWATWPRLPVGTIQGGAIHHSSVGEVTVTYTPGPFGGKERVRVYVMSVGHRFEARGWDNQLIDDGEDILNAESPGIDGDIQQRILGKLSRHKFFFGACILGSVEIEVKVPNLKNLEDAPGANINYELVGAQDQTRCNGSVVTSAHKHNHWGTQTMITAIENISDSWNTEGPIPTPGLRINDIGVGDASEGYGGLFDYKNNWKKPHAEHRVGKNADVGFCGIESSPDDAVQLKAFIRRVTGRTPLVHTTSSGGVDHFHIYTN